MTRGAHPTPLSLVWGSLPPLLVTATQQSGEPLTQKTSLATLIETKRTAALKRQKVNFSCGKEKLIRGPRIQSGRSPEPVQGRVIRPQFAQNKEGSQNMRFLVLKLDSPRQTLTGWPASSRMLCSGPGWSCLQGQGGLSTMEGWFHWKWEKVGAGQSPPLAAQGATCSQGFPLLKRMGLGDPEHHLPETAAREQRPDPGVGWGNHLSARTGLSRRRSCLSSGSPGAEGACDETHPTATCILPQHLPTTNQVLQVLG